eukprot:8278978-Pyramimonas_sp.AAC.1
MAPPIFARCQSSSGRHSQICLAGHLQREPSPPAWAAATFRRSVDIYGIVPEKCSRQMMVD